MIWNNNGTQTIVISEMSLILYKAGLTRIIYLNSVEIYYDRSNAVESEKNRFHEIFNDVVNACVSLYQWT